jgi:hypothetical protein
MLARMRAGQGDEHRYFEGLALAHVLGGLDDSDGRIFRAHLLECSDCRARVGELRAIASELADVERDERRQRAAKAIETKRRETEDDGIDEAEAAAPSRSSRILVLVGLGLVILLSAWNFTLRGENAELQVRSQRLSRATEALEFGQPWTVVQPAARNDETLQFAAKEHNNELAVLITGLEDSEVYTLFLRQSNGQITRRTVVQPDDGRVLSMIELNADDDEIIVTNPEGQPVTDRITGPTVFEAHRAVGDA